MNWRWELWQWLSPVGVAGTVSLKHYGLMWGVFAFIWLILDQPYLAAAWGVSFFVFGWLFLILVLGGLDC